MNQKTPKIRWGIILSRRGSQRLPGKATRPLGGKLLICYTFEAALGATTLDRTWLFSDDPEALRLGAEAGIALPPFERPADVSEGATSTETTLRYFLTQFPASDLPDTMVLLQPTSPFRTSQDIDTAISRFETQTCDAVISVTAPEKPVTWFYEKTEEGFLKAALEGSADWVLPNGALYVFRPASLLAGLPLAGGRIIPYEMPRNRSVDIDTAEDFQWAEFLSQQD